MNATDTITGFRHIALSVTDLDRSAGWYHDVLGLEELFRESDDIHAVVVMKVPGTELIVGLVQFSGAIDEPFSPKRVGLDHLCFMVNSRDDLDLWVQRFEQHGVTHTGIGEMATGPILNFKDPDDIALSFSTSPALPGT